MPLTFAARPIPGWSSQEAWASSSIYHIDAPASVLFGGVRTSGYMVRQILDAYKGRLPEGVVACFAKTRPT
jgi:hypothetical protein